MVVFFVKTHGEIMLQRNPPLLCSKACNAFNDALIKGGHRSVIKMVGIYPDMEFILSMRDEFLRQCSPDEYKLKLKPDRYVTSISDVTALLSPQHKMRVR